MSCLAKGYFRKSCQQHFRNTTQSGITVPNVQLTRLLKATNQMTEIERLSRHVINLLFDDFTRNVHKHPYLCAVMEFHTGILAVLGHSEAEICEQIQALLAEYGVKLTEDNSK
ncbi:MAG: hypothetical protein U1F76_03770 [Candidatus Competibacteraceae bacterium]